MHAYVSKRLTLFCASLMVSIGAFTCHALTEGDYTYTTTSGQATITGFNSSYSGALSIPNTLGECPVTGIGDAVFYSCTGLTSVTIPDSVTRIGDYAFQECIGLPNVTIPNSVTNIGDWAFYYCTGLTSIFIPDSVTSIGKGAFDECYGLTAFTVDAANISYCSMNDILFNKNLTTLIQYPASRTGSYAILDSVTSIGDYAFDYCDSLTSVTIPNSVISIGDGAFYSCTGLTSITIPDSVTRIGEGAFDECYGLTAFTVDAANTFYSSTSGVLFNKNLTTLIQYPASRTGSYVIPDSVTRIGDYAFDYCDSLTSVTIPDSVTSIGEAAFFGCENLATVFFKGNSPSPCSPFSDTECTVYYLPETTGWGTTFDSRPALCWNPTVPHDANFGFASDGFGFNITGTTNIPIVVETTTNLSSNIWAPLLTNTLSNGSLFFSDPSTNGPVRFYRIVWP